MSTRSLTLSRRTFLAGGAAATLGSGIPARVRAQATRSDSAR